MRGGRTERGHLSISWLHVQGAVGIGDHRPPFLELHRRHRSVVEQGRHGADLEALSVEVDRFLIGARCTKMTISRGGSSGGGRRPLNAAFPWVLNSRAAASLSDIFEAHAKFLQGGTPAAPLLCFSLHARVDFIL